MTQPDTQAPPEVPAPPPVWEGWDTVVRAAGVTVSILATIVTAFLELELSALRVGAFPALFAGDSPYDGSGAPLPVAVPVAIGLNAAIAWFAVFTTGKRWAIGPPWALWTLIMLIAASVRTAEGDLLLTQTNLVALVMILTGSLTFAVYAYRMILKPLTTDSGLPAGIQ